MILKETRCWDVRISVFRFSTCMALLILLAPGISLATSIYRVDVNTPSLPGDADGQGWNTAFDNLHAALAVAAHGDEIWVAAGVYRPAPNGAPDPRLASFLLQDGVAVYGGFAGHEFHRDARDPAAHLSILCGDLGGNDAAGIVSDNCYRVVTLVNGLSGECRLDGLTIRGGRADAVPSLVTGAGLYIENARLTIHNCVFTRNYASNNGGAVYVRSGESTQSEVTLSHCAFIENRSSGYGAALHSDPNSTGVQRPALTVEDCVFRDNETHYTLSANSSALVLRRVYFYDNAGGALLANDRIALHAENCVFMRNGGMTSALHIGTRSAATLLHCTVAENTTATAIHVVPYIHAATSLAISHSIVSSRLLPAISVNAPTASNAEISVSCSLISGGYAGAGNMDIPPRFRLPDPPGQPSWDSPSIDFCAHSVLIEDIEGQPRLQNTAFDAGAYEFGQDSDGGGLPDWYEDEYGLDPELPDDDAADTDEDGLNNLEEFRRGTNPIDNTDPPNTFFVEKSGSDETGDGSAALPWKTIAFAMNNMPEGAETFPVTLNVGPGLFDEQVILQPYVRIVGAGAGITYVRYFNISDDDHFVVLAAPGTALSACTVTLPMPVSVTVDLLRVTDVDVAISNCELDGLNSPRAIGVFITGPASSASVIRDSLVRRVEYGVYAIDSGVNITRNRFEDILGGAIFVRAPEGKEDGGAETPLLGAGDQLEETGFNQFRMSTGFFVNNTSASLTMAEYNDWGVYTEEAIGNRVFNSPGDVDYEPFLGKALVRGTIAIELLEAGTWKEIPQSAAPSVQMGSVTASLDRSSSLYLFTNLDPGTYSFTADASGYASQMRMVTLSAGQIVPVTFLLQKDGTNGDGQNGRGCFKSSIGPSAGAPGPKILFGDAPILCVALTGMLLISSMRYREKWPKRQGAHHR